MTVQVPKILVQLVLIPVLYYLGAKLSLALAVTTPEVVVILWVPNSLLLAALCHFHFRRFAVFAAMIILGVAPLPWTVLDLGAKRLWATSSSRS